MPDGPFFGLSPVHLLTPIVIAVCGALRGARSHNIADHKRAMLIPYVSGLLLAGGLTFLPGRSMPALIIRELHVRKGGA